MSGINGELRRRVRWFVRTLFHELSGGECNALFRVDRINFNNKACDEGTFYTAKNCMEFTAFAGTIAFY